MSAPPQRRQQEVWEDEYRANPYLRGKPEKHIIERFSYLSENLTTVTESGKLGFVMEKRRMLWLWRRMTHVFMEFGARGGIPFYARDRLKMPNLTYPNEPPGARAFNSRIRKETGQAFKFSKRCWLQPMLEFGTVRFSPASSYSDPSLNNAIRDDELTFTYFPGKPSAPLSGVTGMDWIMLRHPSDYFVQCFASSFALRLFDDFEADCCLIIYDGLEFGHRVVAKLKSRFPDWIVGGVPITYIDPDDPGDGLINIPAVKHMKYLYQQEQRFICHPRIPIAKLEAFTIQVGPLTDIAELVHLNP